MSMPLRVIGALLAAMLLTVVAPTAQVGEQRLHLNPVIAKLAAGRTVYGLQASADMSMGLARTAARLERLPDTAENPYSSRMRLRPLASR
jgi:hypothetical protein